ncbi:histidinol phosphate phosphatase [Clostridium sediminicola]|uniref:histidinol phosphate phosphatase n=1 Tax=Clostridium sediminicola TaxID=3114879 RepID=UPI0031F265F1
MFDTHVHTTFSSDSQLEIQEVLSRLDNSKLGIITTEHLDLNYPEEKLFKCDIDKYLNTYRKYRGDKLLLGIEMGLSLEKIKEFSDVERKYNFDYVLGAVHEVDGLDLYATKELYKNYSKKEMYEKYFEYMIECVKTHPFIDSLAHIDYICRYAEYIDTEMYYREFADHLDTVFRELIDRDISLEINTRRLNIDSAVKNMNDLYKRYSELGGKYVTLGSDAHKVENVGANYDLAVDMANRNNLKIVYCKNRNKNFDII